MTPRAGLVGIVAGLLLLGACDGGSDDDEPPVRTSTTTSSTTTTSTSSTSPTTLGAEDWDGVRFDFGIIDRIDRTEDGRTLVVFDRTQLDLDPPRSAPDFTEEPVHYANTDVIYKNDNTRLRTYVADDRVEVLRLANAEQACSGLTDDRREAPVWQPTSVDAVVDAALWDDYDQVALTFDPRGLVIRIRLSSGC